MKTLKAWFDSHPVLKRILRFMWDLLGYFILVFLGCYVGGGAILHTIGYWSI